MFMKYTPFIVFFLSLVPIQVHAQPAKSPSEEVLRGRASISPSLVRLDPQEKQKFKIILKAKRLQGADVAHSVKWSVNDVLGGNEEVGTITEDGLYTAPAVPPVPREVHIVADVEGVENRFLFATVVINAPGQPYEMVSSWFEPKGKSRLLVDPHCLCLDKDGNLIIADYNGSRVLRFTPEGKYLGDIGRGTGEKPGMVKLPRVVQMDAAGRIFVSDQKSDKPRIQVFTPEGDFLYAFAEKGIRPGQMLRAHGMVFDSKGFLYVVDVDTMRINVYEPATGKFVRRWGKDGSATGEFNAPHGIAIDRNDDIFVVGYYGPCQKFTADGKFLFDFAYPDPPDGAVYFHSIASDRWGNVYLTVRGAAGYGGAIEDNEGRKVSIMKFNNNGDHICNLTLKVKAHSENWATIDEQGKVYAIFQSNEELGVQVFEPR
ncbi:MAG TPA: hypothetical protein PLN86_02635 [Candidatus Hydrogenedentes bacterium]|nr:hypothetical protein [Candidatus Hydrogenedentota bacterium]